MAEFTYTQIAKMIDHSLLQQVLTDEEMERNHAVAIAMIREAIIRDYARGRTYIGVQLCERWGWRQGCWNNKMSPILPGRKCIIMRRRFSRKD